MIVHKYGVPNDDLRLDISTGKVGPRVRLYIQDLGVLSYVGKTIEFFSQSNWVIEEAQRVVRGELKPREEYLGEIDVNQGLLEGMAYSGNRIFRDHDHTLDMSCSFHDFARKVIDQVESRKKSSALC